jgi:hypothetical protein
MHPFVNEGDRIAVLLAPGEREVLRAVPILLRNSRPEAGDPAWARLRAVGHLEDPGASARFRDLTAGMLESAQASDRDRFEATIDEDLLSPDDAESWLRSIGEARLRVAARLGIEEDGWEEEPLEAELVEMTVLRVLGYLQEALVAVLSERM